MVKYVFVSSMVSYADDAKYFANDGWRMGAPLTTLDKAKTTKSLKAAEEFLSCLKGAGYTSFRINKVSK